MDRNRVREWAPIIARSISGLHTDAAARDLHIVGLREGEVWEIIAAHHIQGDIFGSIKEIATTIISTVELTLRTESDTERNFYDI